MAKILFVDLSTESAYDQPLADELVDLFLGGRGLGAYLLYKYVPAAADPLGSENALIFSTGPLHGTGAPYSSKSVLSTKSPLTGIYLYSVCSSVLGQELAQAGYAALVIKGQAARPAYLAIRDGQVVFADAATVWGQETGPAQAAMLEGAGLGPAACVSIGPAGEALVSLSAVMAGGAKARAFGRGGAGAVFGSKRLKGIVLKGQGKVRVSREEAFGQARSAVNARMRSNPTWVEAKRRFGSGQDIVLVSQLGLLPTRNWHSGVFSDVEAIAPTENYQRWPRTASACSTNCPTMCSHEITVASGPFKGAFSDGPEYETLYSFGANCGVDRFDAIVAAEQICDCQGLDTMSVGVAVGFAMECFERGLLTSVDAGGQELRFGNADAMVDLVRQVAAGTGLGGLLGRGVRSASLRIAGSEPFAMHAKGMELGGLESRGAWGQSLEYMLSSRGGCHHAYGRPALVEVQSGTGTQVAGKGELIKRLAIIRIVYDSAVMCTFPSGILGLEAPVALVNAARGIDMTLADAEALGFRVLTLERLFNVREGLRRKDDVLPDRLTMEPAPEGPGRGQTVPVQDLLDDGYRAMGWNADGVPLPETVERTGLAGYVQ